MTFWCDDDPPILGHQPCDVTVDAADPEPVGTILDRHGQVLAVVYPDRPPFGFQPTIHPSATDA